MQCRFHSHMSVITTADLLHVLECVEVGFGPEHPSGVDLGWTWNVRPVDGEDVRDNLNGWVVRATFVAPDAVTGAPGHGTGRWWFVSRSDSVSAIVRTAFLAIRQALDHELHEAFRFGGVRVFDPHTEIDELTRMAEVALDMPSVDRPALVPDDEEES